MKYTLKYKVYFKKPKNTCLKLQIEKKVLVLSIII